MNANSLAKYEKRLLLGGRWMPVTQKVVFVRADPDRCIDVMTAHQDWNYVRRFGQPRRRRVVHGDGLEPLLSRLLPLRSVEEDKHLFLPTRNPGWTAMFTDRFQGAGAVAPSASWGVASVTVVDSPDGPRPDGWRAPVGYRYFSLSEPCEEWVGYGGRTESGASWTVTVGVNDSERWVFELGGARDRTRYPSDDFPPPVGKVWDETARLTPHRFTHDHLRLACERLGLFPFDEDFYAPDGWGVVMERDDPAASEQKGYTLAQARGEEPYQF